MLNIREIDRESICHINANYIVSEMMDCFLMERMMYIVLELPSQFNIYFMSL